MAHLSLIQLGDVHFPDLALTSPAIDHKDKAAPAAVVDLTKPDRIRNSLRALLRVMEERRKEIAGLAICGDLTSRGQADGYNSCVEYLERNLQLTNTAWWQPNQIHAVPGNHDIDRAMCDPAGHDVYQKFIPLEGTWSAIGLPILTTRSLRKSELSLGSLSTTFYSLNSCIGCGETRRLPAAIRADLQRLLKPHVDSATTAAAFDLVGEKLDTPAFAEENITELVADITTLPKNQIPIILAHHNLLPQSLVRYEIYTEVINSGLVRSRLTQCKRPIIYCHGHIHRSPVEVVGDPTDPSSKLILISAPQLFEGFNVIEIHYSRSGSPIGCKVLQYGTDPDHGGLSIIKRIRIPLQDARQARLFSDELTKVVAECLTKNFLTFTELREAVSNARSGGMPSNKTLAHAIDDLAWIGLVDVHDHEQEKRVWRVRRMQP